MSFAESELRTYVLAWRETAKAWFARHGRRVTLVIPSYRDSHLLKELFAGLDSSTPIASWDAIVTDDASDDPAHAAYLDALEASRPNVRVLRNAENGGFARNVNRALEGVPHAVDVVLMNSDIVPLDGWLASLQYSLSQESADLIAPKLLYPDRRIQFCGGMRHVVSRTNFDHRLRFAREYFPPATVRIPTLYATGALLYIPAATRARLGSLDPRYSWGHDDVDYAIACWQGGGRVAVEPRAVAFHQESVTIGRRSQDERVAQSHHRFLEKNAAFFRRTVRQADGRIRVILLTGDVTSTDLGWVRGQFGHLPAEDFACEHWIVGDDIGDAPAAGVRVFANEAAVVGALDTIDAFKICTGWRLAHAVWLGASRRGIPVYRPLRREISLDPVEAARIQASFLPEFAIIAGDEAERSSIADSGYPQPVRVADARRLASALSDLAAAPDFGFYPAP